MNKLQTFLQEEILKRLYPGKSLEEAKQEELKFGCKVTVLEYDTGESCDNSVDVVLISNDELITIYDGELVDFGHEEVWQGEFLQGFIIQNIIGLPLSLPRVLQALGDIYIFADGGIVHTERKWMDVCDRNLLNEDMTDATLFDQSEETQEAIAKLLGR